MNEINEYNKYSTALKNAKHCNCQQKDNYPMNGARLEESLLYYTNVSCNDNNYKPKLYKGSCETTSMKRYSDHKNHLTYHCTNMTLSYQENI